MEALSSLSILFTLCDTRTENLFFTAEIQELTVEPSPRYPGTNTSIDFFRNTSNSEAGCMLHRRWGCGINWSINSLVCTPFLSQGCDWCDCINTASEWTLCTVWLQDYRCDQIHLQYELIVVLGLGVHCAVLLATSSGGTTHYRTKAQQWSSTSTPSSGSTSSTSSRRDSTAV